MEHIWSKLVHLCLLDYQLLTLLLSSWHTCQVLLPVTGQDWLRYEVLTANMV